MTTAVVPVSLRDGHHAWWAQSEDTIDWGATSGTCHFTVDNTSPALPVLHPVTSSDYFDAPGSTIKFSTVSGDGDIYLVQEAHATGSDLVVAAGVTTGAAQQNWLTQAQNLRGLMGTKWEAPDVYK